jgi:FdhD protein
VISLFKELRCLKADGADTSEILHPVVEEVPLSIFINGKHYTTAMTSPGMEREFVLGHLLSERIIRGLDEVESLEVEKNIVRAVVKNPIRAIASRRPILSGCGGTSSFLDKSKLPTIESDLKLSAEEIFSALKSITLSDLHRATGGVHSVGLFCKMGQEERCPDADGLKIVVEDIGRHNALDKAIGYGLTNGFEFKTSFVTCTGRISSDMALKCSVAGIPVIASRGATTSLAIEIAQRTGLTVVGFVRGSRMNIYAGCERVLV